MVIWMIGLSCSGKTVIAKEMVKQLRRNKTSTPWVLVDGDDYRAISGLKLGHTIDDRRRNAEGMISFCSFLDRQGINVIACILSIFPEHLESNKQRFSDYREVFIDASMETLQARDNKRLYERASAGELSNVVGVDIDFPKPKSPDVTLVNNLNGEDPTELSTKLLADLGLPSTISYEYTSESRLDNPHKYQYTQYFGKNFMQAYFQNRKKMISEIAKKRSGLKLPVTTPYQARDPEVLNVKDDISDNQFSYQRLLSIVSSDPRDMELQRISGHVVNGRIVTHLFLLSQFEALENQSWIWEKHGAELLLLIKRFEVSKKVYDEYESPSFKKRSNRYEHLINYPLFHLLLSEIHCHCNTRQKMIVANCMLKVGDIIVADLPKFSNTECVLLAHASLCREIDIIREIN